MPTFFRKTRQNLISKSNTMKYFKYAIGEIILVMIGILLALQVSNWNQDRKDRISERKLLDNIHRDFVRNKVNFDSVKVINFRNIAALDSMVGLFPIGGDTVKMKNFWDYSRLTKAITYNPSSSTVKSIINSNSLELIEDETLQEYLVSWEDVLIDYLEEEVAYFKLMKEEYHPFLVDNLDYTLNNQEMNRAVTSSVKFQNLVIWRRNSLNGIIKAIRDEPIENHINEIIRLTQPKNQ